MTDRELLRKKLYDTASHKEEAFSSHLQSFVNVNCPDRLYRYRSVNNNNVEAFRDDKIYMASTGNLNDPYDTLLMCVNPLISRVTNKEFKIKTLSEQLMYNIYAMLRDRIVQFQNSMLISCYTDKYDSMLMWSHYADYHRGFVLEYSRETLIDTDTPFCPVLYSDNRFDATRTIIQPLMLELAKSMRIVESDCKEIPEKLVPEEIRSLQIHKAPNPNEALLSCFVKSIEWSYENEWRHVSSKAVAGDGSTKDYFLSHIKPSAIYYGTRISSEHYKELHDIALEKNLREFEMKVDFSEPEYKLERSELDK